jgi:hypothetical protein
MTLFQPLRPQFKSARGKAHDDRRAKAYVQRYVGARRASATPPMSHFSPNQQRLKKVQSRGAREWTSAGVLLSYGERVRRSATKDMTLFQPLLKGEAGECQYLLPQYIADKHPQ